MFGRGAAGQQLREVVGSSYYVSPECLKGSYSFPTDLWSAGVIIYIMLSGLPPFNGANTREVFRNIVDAPLNLNCDPWQARSQLWTHLLPFSAGDGLVSLDARQKITVSLSLAI